MTDQDEAKIVGALRDALSKEQSTRDELETQLSSMVSARDLTIRDLRTANEALSDQLDVERRARVQDGARHEAINRDLQEDRRRALKLADALTSDTQTCEEATAALVALVEDAREDRDRARGALEQIAALPADFTGMAEHDRVCQVGLRAPDIATAALRPFSAGPTGPTGPVKSSTDTREKVIRIRRRAVVVSAPEGVPVRADELHVHLGGRVTLDLAGLHDALKPGQSVELEATLLDLSHTVVWRRIP